jgi:hypothetical protein
LDRPVEVTVTPRDQWIAAYRKMGFSQAAADSYARMTAISIDAGFETPGATERGKGDAGSLCRSAAASKA